MLDELKEEGIVNKVGGRFKLSTLIQKRMVALNTGARPLVDVRGGDRLQTVVQEILQDKIYLDLEGNLKTREAYETDGTVSPSRNCSSWSLKRAWTSAGLRFSRMSGRSVRRIASS